MPVFGLAAALLFAIAPCYVFVPLGAPARMWCGYKSAPPHFALQFWVGAAVGTLGSLWLLRRSSR